MLRTLNHLTVEEEMEQDQERLDQVAIGNQEILTTSSGASNCSCLQILFILVLFHYNVALCHC